jgi:uncharacterized RDD family membrane protein YckC
MAETAPTYLSCRNHPDVTSGLVHCARCGVAFCPDCVVQIDGRPYDAACKEEHVRELRSGTSAPQLASAGRRFTAMFVDGLVVAPLWVTPMILYPNAKPFEHPFWQIVVPFTGWVLYEAILLTRYRGQTLGKKAAHIRVISRNGSPLSGKQAAWRALSRNLMAYTYVPGFIDALMVFSSSRRTLHDRAAGTVVVDARP